MYSPPRMPEPPRRTGRSSDRPIVLVGLMGAGKSTVGRRLASLLGGDFADSDSEVERAEGRTVAEIFARDGEAWFRQCERRAIARLVAGPAKVIAVGGGAFADGQTRALVLERGIVVWLDADPAVLAARVGRDGRRPLIGAAEPLVVLERLAAERKDAYAQAHLRISTGDAAPEIVAERILAALAERQS
jgi:shikimate kinase